MTTITLESTHTEAENESSEASSSAAQSQPRRRTRGGDNFRDTITAALQENVKAVADIRANTQKDEVKSEYSQE